MSEICGVCGSHFSYSYSGKEMFCVNPRCQNFMLASILTGGKRVFDSRYEATALPDSDPNKKILVKALLDSDDYMKQLAGIRTIEFMSSKIAVELLTD